MSIMLDMPVPETGHLSVRVHTDVQISISAAEAQRRVTRYVHGKISSQMHGGTPALILGQRVCWRVPVHLTFPSVGEAGIVGNMDVDGSLAAVGTTARSMPQAAVPAAAKHSVFVF